MTENITISKDVLIKAYENGSADCKNVLEYLYGKDLFRGNVTGRVKTFEDAVNELGQHHPFVYLYYEFLRCNTNQKDALAFLKLRIIAAALNEGWEPTFTAGEERYYPRIYVYTQDEIDDSDDDELADMFLFDKPIGPYVGVRSAVSDDVAEQVYLDTNSRLCFKSEELADYASKQFIDIYADYYLK